MTEFFPARLSGSRVAYALGMGDERYGTPLQEQRRLLGTYTPDPIPERDPDHPACQGQSMEATILEQSSWRWEQLHGHPIEVIHAAAMAPKTEIDPAGGLLLEHPTAPIECHPDAYFVCHECNCAWLADAKRYGSSLDATAAKDELRAQLAFNLAISLACRDELPLPDGCELSTLALGAVLRVDTIRQQDEDGEWFARAVFVPDCLEVPTTPKILEAIVATTSQWMHRYVLPWFEGSDVPDAPPKTYQDICLLWPEPKPGKVIEDPDAELIALIEEHYILSTAEQGATLELEGYEPLWWNSKEIAERRKELKREILLITQDAEAVAGKPGDDVFARFPVDRWGKRHVDHRVTTYNKQRKAALKRAAKLEEKQA